MRIAIFVGLGVLGIFFAPPAQALTISNADADTHTITVKTGGDSTELVVEPDKAVDAPCASGCTILLENGEQYEMKGGEEVAIEGGIIFVDAVPGGEDAGGQTGAVHEPGDDAAEDQPSGDDASEEAE